MKDAQPSDSYENYRATYLTTHACDGHGFAGSAYVSTSHKNLSYSPLEKVLVASVAADKLLPDRTEAEEKREVRVFLLVSEKQPVKCRLYICEEYCITLLTNIVTH